MGGWWRWNDLFHARARDNGSEALSAVRIDEEIEVRLTSERREQVIVALPGAVAHPGIRQVVEARQQSRDGTSLDGVPAAGDG
jgi:hypothetical protein